MISLRRMTKNKEKFYNHSSSTCTKYEKPCDQMLATFQFFFVIRIGFEPMTLSLEG